MVARITIACLAIVALLVVTAVANTKGTIETIAGGATGTSIAIGSEHLGASHATFSDITIHAHTGEPLAHIAHVDVRYDLRDLLPGGNRLYGLESFAIDDPSITLIRHRDGTWNFTLPPSKKTSAPGAPAWFDGTIRNGTVTVIDESQGTPGARRLRVAKIDAVLHVHQGARTQYRASLAYLESGKSYPVSGTGDVNPNAGYSVQRWRVPAMPIARIVDVAVNSPSFHLASGSITGSGVRIIGLDAGSSALQTQVSATTQLEHVRAAIGGLVKPVREVHGRIDLYDNGLTFDGVHGTMNGVPLRMLGGVYDLSQPRFRIAIQLHGDLAQLREAIAQAAHLPMSGPVDLAVLLEGRASNPLAMIALDGSRIVYATTPIDHPHALVAFSQAEFDVLDAHAISRNVSLGAQGRVALTRRPNAIELLAGARAPNGALPYANDVLPGMPLDGMLLATADDPKRIDTRGIVHGTTNAQRLAGTFAIDNRGVGTVGPVLIDGSRGMLYAQARIDHPHNRESGSVAAQHFVIAQGLLPFPATLDGTMNGTVTGRQLAANGSLALHDANGGRIVATAATGSDLGIDASVVAQNVRYGRYALSGLSSLHYAHDALAIAHTDLAAGPALVALDGTVGALTSHAPRYDLHARARAVDAHELVALVQPSRAKYIDGSIDADLAIHGSGASPDIAGTLDVPAGDVNGQGFRDLHATLDGTPSALAFSNGGVIVDRTDLAFNGVAGAGGATVSLRAPHAYLSDFNDLFDTGETLGGSGSVMATVSYAPGAPIESSGHANLSDVRYRRFPIGSTVATWSSAGGTIAFDADAGGASGAIRAHGRVNPSTQAVNAAATAHALALQTWLPLLGINEPVLGSVNASGTVRGRFPDVDSQISAQLVHGSAFGIPVQTATVALHTAGGTGTVDRALVVIPNARAAASGGFGLHAHDPLDLVAKITSPDIGAVAREAGVKAGTLAGSLATTVTLRGTRVAPQLADALTLTKLRYGKMTVPRITAQAVATRTRVTLKRGEADLAPGRVVLAGSVPLPMRDAPFTASLLASDVDLAQFAALLPSGTSAGGRIDGRMSASGRTDAPQFGGLLTLANGSYSSPMMTTPVHDAHAELAFHGTSVALRNTTASLGGGALRASGRASVPSVRDIGALAFDLHASADNARVDLPAYYKGLVNGTLVARRVPRGMTELGGTVALSSGRVPMTALYNPGATKAPASAPLPIAFHDLHVTVGDDVRVQSPNVDVGARGGVTVAGTLASPSLRGRFHSTGGTLSFYRDFTLDRGAVSFDPQSGIIPYVNAVATTTISNPDTDIRLHVQGPATDMQLGLASDPSYSRSQILGLLVGAQNFGAVQGVAATSPGSFSASNSVASLAEGQLNTVFTRSLLEPLSNALGGAFGFNNVQLTNSLTGGFGASFVKAFGHDLSARFAESFGQPRRQSLTLESRPSKKAISLSAVFYTQEQPSVFGTLSDTNTHQGVVGANVLSIQPMSGTNGVNLNLERKFP